MLLWPRWTFNPQGGRKKEGKKKERNGLVATDNGRKAVAPIFGLVFPVAAAATAATLSSFVHAPLPCIDQGGRERWICCALRFPSCVVWSGALTNFSELVFLSFSPPISSSSPFSLAAPSAMNNAVSRNLSQGKGRKGRRYFFLLSIFLPPPTIFSFFFLLPRPSFSVSLPMGK